MPLTFLDHKRFVSAQKELGQAIGIVNICSDKRRKHYFSEDLGSKNNNCLKHKI